MRFLMLRAVALLLLAIPTPVLAQPRAAPGEVRVRLVTSEGAIVLALDARRAPRTTANFLAYVDDGRLDDTEFYRSSRRTGNPKLGFVQGGIATDARRMLDAVPLEPTSRTGLRHTDGTVSLAHGADPNSGNGNFSIMVGDNPSLDARGPTGGYAAFGHVVSGMDVVRRILAKPTGGGRGVMRGQMIQPPVRIIRAERLDGAPKPSGRPKPWLLGLPRR
ncbi:peptidylprolyl isomerase [Sphingomonas sp. CJ20]